MQESEDSIPNLTSYYGSDSSSDAYHSNSKSSMSVNREDSKEASAPKHKEESTRNPEELWMVGNTLFYQDNLNKAINVLKQGRSKESRRLAPT